MANYQVDLITTAALVADGHVVLVKFKGMRDQQGGLFLPNDTLNELEHPTDGAKRVLREQIGIDFELPLLKNIESFRGRNKTWHLSFHHLCQLPRRLDLKPSADLAAAQWFSLDALPPRDQFAHHGWSLETLKKIGAM